MLSEISSRHLSEWMAYDTIKHTEQTKAALAAKAEAGLTAMKAKGSRGHRR